MKVLSLARDLKRRKARERASLFVAEGVRAVDELLRSGIVPRGVLAAADAVAEPRIAALLAAARSREIPVQEVTSADFASAADTESPQGILAVAPVPDRKLAELPEAEPLRLLALDAVQDPGNVGTMLRTAAALGAAGTLALPGTVDLWNAKVVRSAMGAHYHHPCLSCTWAELDAFRQSRQLEVWGTDALGEALEGIAAPRRLILLVGNEGSGLSPSARAVVDRLVGLPLRSTTESLNVAVAAGIFLYQLRR